MKTLSELDHYDVLEVERAAAAEEIERAYRLLRSTFGTDSLATYSVYDEDEAAAMCERLDLAYRVLSDPEARAEYDRALEDPSSLDDAEDELLELALELERKAAPQVDALPSLESFEESELESDAPWDGSRLRRNRLQRGIEIDEIAQITKVNPTYLRFIEEEQFEGLPAPVYVRGFVTAYARCLGLEPRVVVPDYIERVEAARAAASQGGRFSGARASRRPL